MTGGEGGEETVYWQVKRSLVVSGGLYVLKVPKVHCFNLLCISISFHIDYAGAAHENNMWYFNCQKSNYHNPHTHLQSIDTHILIY